MKKSLNISHSPVPPLTTKQQWAFVLTRRIIAHNIQMRLDAEEDWIDGERSVAYKSVASLLLYYNYLWFDIAFYSISREMAAAC